MNIYLNGQPFAIVPATSIGVLLSRLDLLHQRVAVEVNGEIVPRSQHDKVILAAADKVEIIHAIGGG